MSSKSLLAAALLLMSPGALQAQSVKAGIEAWQRADYSSAVEIWRPLAEKGDADAAFNLGQAYRLGRGVPINLAAAKDWFERAANKGHVDAQTTLGLLLFQNGDQAEGLRWLKGAADKGEPRALLVYGTALVNGDGVTQDPAVGYAYVSRAAAQGLAPAKETLKQLDGILSAEDRRKGIAMARANARAKRPDRPKREPAKPEKVAAAKSAPSRPTATVTTPPVASGAWRIQLGAFSQRGSAETMFRRLSSNRVLAGRQAFYIPAGAITRLQVGPFESRAAATAACRAIAAGCFPVLAK